MATAFDETLKIVTRDLVLLNALSSAAADLAERSTAEGLSQPTRAALRNQAKSANEQAGALLTRATVELFNDPPTDATTKINDAIVETETTLANIAKAKKAIEFVSALLGVASAVLSGDWKGVLKALEALAKKKVDGAPAK